MRRTPTVKLYKPTTKKGKESIQSEIWWMRWSENGKRRYESTGTRNSRIAQQRARARQAEFDRGETGLRDVTWVVAKQEFLDYKMSTRESSTSEAYGFSLAAFERIVTPSCVTEIDIRALQQFAAARCDEEVVAATVNKDLKHLRCFLNWAVKQRYLRKAPKFDDDLFIPEDQDPPIVIPRDELLAMLTALDSGKLKLTKRPASWWRLFVRLAYNLGMRRGEILGLRWNSVDLEKAELTILTRITRGRKAKKGKKITKGHKYRIMPLAPELVAMLREWKESCPGEECVLPYNGNLRHLYEDWHKFAGDRVPKNCRSSCGSQLVEAGVPSLVVRDWLGHSTVTTTENFYVNTAKALRPAAAARKVV